MSHQRRRDELRTSCRFAIAAMLHVAACAAGSLASEVWADSFLPVREQPVVTVVETQGGDVELDGNRVTLEALAASLRELKRSEGVVWYYGEGFSAMPSEGSPAIDIVRDSGVPLLWSRIVDFSDLIETEPDATVIARAETYLVAMTGEAYARSNYTRLSRRYGEVYDFETEYKSTKTYWLSYEYEPLVRLGVERPTVAVVVPEDPFAAVTGGVAMRLDDGSIVEPQISRNRLFEILGALGIEQFAPPLTDTYLRPPTDRSPRWTWSATFEHPHPSRASSVRTTTVEVDAVSGEVLSTASSDVAVCW